MIQSRVAMFISLCMCVTPCGIPHNFMSLDQTLNSCMPYILHITLCLIACSSLMTKSFGLSCSYSCPHSSPHMAHILIFIMVVPCPISAIAHIVLTVLFKKCNFISLSRNEDGWESIHSQNIGEKPDR